MSETRRGVRAYRRSAGEIAQLGQDCAPVNDERAHCPIACGGRVVRYSFLVGLFHSLLHAGLAGAPS